MHTITHNNAQAICDAIRAASVSSSANIYVPILQGVHLRVRGDVLTVTGTDRYRLTRATVEGVASDGGDLNVTFEDVSALLKVLPRRTVTGKPGKGGTGPISIEIGDTTATFAFDFGQQVARVRVAPGDYPETDRLGDRDAIAATHVKMNPRFLADLAKHPLERDQAPVLTFRGREVGPMMRAGWTAYGVRYTYLVMGHQLTDADLEESH